MNIRRQVQGFAIGAAVMAAVMLGAPIAMAPHAPVTATEQIAKDFGVKIVWDITVCRPGHSEHIRGCFLPEFPDTVFVSHDTPRMEMYLVLHEISHVYQNRLGVKQNECAADRFAQSFGVGYGFYCPAPLN